METCFNYCEQGRGFFSSDERKWITKIHKLKEQYPDKVRIIRESEVNDGCIYCELPTEWLKIIVPRKTRDYSEEERKQIAERLNSSRKKKEEKELM